MWMGPGVDNHKPRNWLTEQVLGLEEIQAELGLECEDVAGELTGRWNDGGRRQWQVGPHFSGSWKFTL